MIRLENITVKKAIPYGNYNIQKFINEKGAVSVEDVLHLMAEYPEYDWDEIRKNCKNIQREMEKANAKGCEAEIYYTKGYENSELLKQDAINYGNILLFDNPTAFRYGYDCFKNKSIAQIKEDLSHTAENWQNYISSANCEYRNIGSKSLPRIISLVEMFEEQIERQSHLTPDREINLFELDKNEKLEFIEEIYRDIVLYLVDNANERLVWGSFSDFQKKIYISSVMSTRQIDRENKERIKTYIANYTTLPELEEAKHNDLKVLKRFIIK